MFLFIDSLFQLWYYLSCRRGSLAQLGEHLPYKQGVTGSSPVTSTKHGPVVQLVRTLACHARGRGFEPHPGRQIGVKGAKALHLASVAQSVEQGTENPRVDGSIPSGGTNSFRGFSSSGRAPPCQGGGSEFEPRNPLHTWRHSQVVRQRSAKPLCGGSNPPGASIWYSRVQLYSFFCNYFYFCV